jgi:capsular polysaccharide biosynthesis protein
MPVSETAPVTVRPSPSDYADSRVPRTWRIQAGRITYFNIPPGLVPDFPIADKPVAMTLLTDAFVSRKGALGSERPIKQIGALYTSDGNVLPEFREQGDKFPKLFANPPLVEPERIAAAERIDDTVLYLGNLSGHFGHFLIESLARAWALALTAPDLPVLFHTEMKVRALAPFVSAIFNALGLDPKRLILANRDLSVRHLLVPESQYTLHWKANRNFAATFDRIRQGLVPAKIDRNLPKRIYLTRRFLSATTPAQINKLIANEQEIEALFERRQYQVVAPERLPFLDQVAMISNATHIAGSTGSAMHMVLFNPNPDTKVISVDTRLQKTQPSLEALRGSEAVHILAAKDRLKPGIPHVMDTEMVERALQEWL